MIATFFRDPGQGEVSRRTAYIRNNGISDGVPSFTIISNRCAHLGCPVQPSGPVVDNERRRSSDRTRRRGHADPDDPAPAASAARATAASTTRRATAPPGRRCARSTATSSRSANGRLVLLGTYSVAYVDGTGAAAKIHKYTLAGPGQHVDGPQSLLYPVQPPH